jgi:hypothetical protein
MRTWFWIVACTFVRDVRGSWQDGALQDPRCRMYSGKVIRSHDVCGIVSLVSDNELLDHDKAC